jgi:hypothetical protein
MSLKLWGRVVLLEGSEMWQRSRGTTTTVTVEAIVRMELSNPRRILTTPRLARKKLKSTIIESRTVVNQSV